MTDYKQKWNIKFLLYIFIIYKIIIFFYSVNYELLKIKNKNIIAL